MFVNTVWALLPPVIAIVLALIIKETYSSLFIGIFIAALFLTKFNVVKSVDLIIGNSKKSQGMMGAIVDNAGLFIFFVILGTIVCIVTKSGGSAAFGRWAKIHIKTKVGALLATFVLGVLIFIDDYFNCLTVGSVMRPVTDEHKISRPKLAYIIDATAAPVCMIAPISSWAAAVSGVANDMHSKTSGIQLFIRAIPYNFYSILTLVFIVTICLMNFDYGKMKEFEKLAVKGDISSIEGESEETVNPKGKVIDMVLPVVLLIIVSIIALIRVGGFFEKGDNYFNFIRAFSNTVAFEALPWAGIITLIFTVAYVRIRKLMEFKECMECIQKGFYSMVPPMVILVLAVTLKGMTNSLGADVFVHNLVQGIAGSLYNLLPAVVFVVACILAFASGTSWGTFGILIPIVTSIFPSTSNLLIIGISACLAGAVCGDHCSPISDTTIMSSAGAQCEHVNHVRTQLPYAITVAMLSFIMYVIAGCVQNAAVCLVIGSALTVVTLFVIKKLTYKKP